MTRFIYFATKLSHKLDCSMLHTGACEAMLPPFSSRFSTDKLLRALFKSTKARATRIVQKTMLANTLVGCSADTVAAENWLNQRARR